MAYEYEVFLSYRRSQTAGLWVQHHLLPRLQARMNEVCGEDVRISCDIQMEAGTRWPDELKRRIRSSKLLLAVWSADYFRSNWCMAEWKSFKSRENALGLFSEEKPHGLVYPVRYADGDFFHPDAKATQCRKDFSRHSTPDPCFRLTDRYVEFDDMVRSMSEELALHLSSTPDWRNDFPIEEPAPLPSATIPRPIL